MPTRTCAGCHEKDEKSRMLRVVRTSDGGSFDPAQRQPGRGAYVHANAGCIEKAVRRGGLAKALKKSVPAAGPGSVAEALKASLG